MQNQIGGQLTHFFFRGAVSDRAWIPACAGMTAGMVRRVAPYLCNFPFSIADLSGTLFNGLTI
jgi:hypothetical protein